MDFIFERNNSNKNFNFEFKYVSEGTLSSWSQLSQKFDMTCMTLTSLFETLEIICQRTKSFEVTAKVK